MLNKQAILDSLDFMAFYRGLIPSLTGEPQGSSKCPFHDDLRASFSVNLYSGAWKCHAGCGEGNAIGFYMRLKGLDFKTALRELGDIAGLKQGEYARMKAIYDYKDENGVLLYQVVRYEPKDFRPRRKGPDGSWIYDLQGVRRVPYNFSELVSASGVIIVEGEKDADNIKALGFAGSTAVTTSQGGAKGWRPEYSDYFLSKQVAIIPDNDRPGFEYAETVARSLQGKVSVIKIVELPDLGERKEKHGLDVSDWIGLRHKEGKADNVIKAELAELIKDASAWEPKPTDSASRLHDSIYTRETGKPKISTLGDILNYPNPEYLLEPFLYLNTLNLLTAYAGVGKSVLSMSIAHAVVTGLPLWGHFQVHRTGGVLIIDEENPGAFLKERLVKMGFKEGLPIYFLHYQGIKLDDPVCFASLIETISEIKPALVVFDALIRLHNAKENDNSEMAYVMGKLRELINHTGITALIIHHDGKGDGDKKKRARGSSDIVGSIDNQICLEPKDDDTLLLSPGKTRVAPFRPIKLKMEGEGDALQFTYLGRDGGESEEVLKEILEILEGASLGVDAIREALEGRGLKIGKNKLRDILKRATGKELEADTGLNQKLVYRVNEGFTASRGIYSPVNRETDLGEPVTVLEVIE